MIKKIDFKDKKFLNFLKNIESKYFENRSIKNSPWKFKNLKHFYFKQLTIQKKIIGIMVYSKHYNNYHLNFLYVEKKHRNCGAGNTLMKYLMNKKDKKIFTIHVNKNLKAALRFYYTIGFKKYKNNTKLKMFIKKCKNFNPKVYKTKYLISKELK